MFGPQEIIIDIYFNTDQFQPDISFDLETANVRNLQITSQIDAACQSLPLGYMTVEIKSNTNLSNAKRVCVVRWGWKIARDYKVKSVQLLEDGYVKIEGESWLGLMDEVELPDAMLANESLSNEIAFVSDNLPVPINFNVDYGQSTAISGYAPEQNGRERLIWLLYTLRGFISDDGNHGYNTAYTFRPFPTNARLVPAQNTLYRPIVTLREKTSRVVITCYDFLASQSMLLDEDDYRFPDGWTALEMDLSSDTLWPDTNGTESGGIEIGQTGATGNADTVIIDNIYFVTSGIGPDVLRRLATYYLNRRVVTLDVLNADYTEAEGMPEDSGFTYKTGDRVIVYVDVDRLVTGVIEKITYNFGNNISASMVLACVEDVQGGWLNVNYKCNNAIIGRDKQYYPIGHTYTLVNRAIRRVRGRAVTIYSPAAETTTGVLASDGQTIDINYTKSS